jgi:hypothetical protein
MKITALPSISPDSLRRKIPLCIQHRYLCVFTAEQYGTLPCTVVLRVEHKGELLSLPSH